MLTSPPNLLTLSRVAAVPLVVATFYLDGHFWHWVALGIFAVAGITDFFDGWLARRNNQISSFGRFLDPIADKLLVAAILLMLAAFHRMSPITFLPAVVILCREILVSGLREFLAETKVSMPVSRLAKWKTTLQMVAIGVLIVGDAGPEGLPVRLIGELGLWLAAALTMVTGYDYLVAGLPHIRKPLDKP
ncbi:MAG: CDP-diacylglycerol--glycerol-3-phosphate 3-phosphatidyltransferase [Alphaproteobacteria bacterium]|nr:CDP-diacylglycerol--glycerol-3-phosphate 3-phosphatidyltransferase [Alphaproteobacteria bacterium]MBF0356105.1 CDP-diacylglycerol--glycerol-3-phosphate 3-phosphatidyltransferase [Alphaproteobacteria bacterium]